MAQFNVIEAINMAMEAESKAREFYAHSAEKVSSERGKNLLKQLAEFEDNHYNRLNELKASLEEDKGYIDYSGTEFKPYSPSSTSEVSGRLDAEKSDVLDILNLAIEAESKAYEHYSDMANNIDDEQGRAMFLRFAEEEKAHRRILSDEFYYMNNKNMNWFWGD